mmetsp:Transcript_40271/g.66108  ORF Transcript_40271/g.66108 Transcript_40271/m.66108 type:complete len:206 (+) Transcript_40271:165-782(+)
MRQRSIAIAVQIERGVAGARRFQRTNGRCFQYAGQTFAVHSIVSILLLALLTQPRLFVQHSIHKNQRVKSVVVSDALLIVSVIMAHQRSFAINRNERAQTAHFVAHRRQFFQIFWDIHHFLTAKHQRHSLHLSRQLQQCIIHHRRLVGEGGLECLAGAAALALNQLFDVGHVLLGDLERIPLRGHMQQAFIQRRHRCFVRHITIQ